MERSILPSRDLDDMRVAYESHGCVGSQLKMTWTTHLVRVAYESHGAFDPTQDDLDDPSDERKSERESPKRTISTSGGPESLQMEGKSASEDAGPEGGGLRCPTLRVDLVAVPHRLEEGKSANEDAGPEGGGLRCPTLVGKGTTLIRGRKECQRGRWPRSSLVSPPPPPPPLSGLLVSPELPPGLR
ncbi:hypothetical protein SDJN02_23887, partial [Cucurbita argyrosperma subsp. argyrosperma]